LPPQNKFTKNPVLYLIYFTSSAFAKLRIEGRAVRFVSIKIINIFFNIFSNIFFLTICPAILKNHPQSIINLIYSKLCENKSLPKLSKATYEALYVGISRNYENLFNESNEQIQTKFKSLLADDLFSVDSLKGGLSSKDGVHARLSKSIEIFS
jgi:hypothetical protein